MNKSKSKSKQIASSYNLIRGSKKQISPFCALYKALNRQTSEVWHAKVINNQMIKQYQLGECLEFNEVVLMNCKQLQNIICVNQIFFKGGSTFIIQEMYSETLEDLVKQQCPLLPGKVQDILCDVIAGLIQLYNEKYYTRSLRPQHIVCVDEVWKIQSFVFNHENYGIDSQYCWNSKFASPQDRSKQQQLSQRQIDEQLVWNIGILGLYMLLGPKFQYDKITKNTFIPWSKVKQLSSQSLYRFLVKALKVDFKQRMRLKQLLNDEIFCNLEKSDSNPFLSYSKFYTDQSDKSSKSNKKGLNITPQIQNKIQILKNDIQRFKYFTEVQKYTQQLPFKNNFDMSLIRYLCFKISFQNLTILKNELQSWKIQNPFLRGYIPLKQIEEDLVNFIGNIKGLKINYSKNIKGLEISKSEVELIKGTLYQQINDQKIPYQGITDLFKKMAGTIYTLISHQCENKINENKQRTICFYSLAAYLLHYYNVSQFSELKLYQKNGILSLSKLINEAPIPLIIELTQKLIKKYFATASQFK